MSKPVIVIGAGGHAKVLLEALRASGVTVLGITDSDRSKHGTALMGVQVLGDDSVLAAHPPDSVLLGNGIGSVETAGLRAALFERLKGQGYVFASIRHPSAVIAPDVALAEGVQVMAGAVIQPCCSIGRNAIVNTRTAVDHDCTIGDHVHLAPGVTLSGGTRIGSGTLIGAGATVIQGITIGSNCLVAAGSVVIKNVPDNTKVMGVPAKEVRR